MVSNQIARMRAREQFLTQERLRQMLSYDPETGIFVWLQKPASNIVVGRRAGQLRNDGHRVINVDGVRIYEHRLAWLYVHGVWPEQHIDHTNMDGADNRLSNLREAQGSDNYGNRGLRKDNTTGIKGVVFYRDLWWAKISLNGRTKNLGSFATSWKAAETYREAAEQHFGEFARIVR